MRPRGWALVVASSVMAGGCAVGPNYKRPQVAVPTQWTVPPERGTSAKAIERDDWWASFQDAELNSLIMRAVAQNLDLQLALERVQEARAARGVVRSSYFPSVDATASASRNRQRVIAAPNEPGKSAAFVPIEYNNFQGGLSALWELDVFGGIRRGVQAATADLA